LNEVSTIDDIGVQVLQWQAGMTLPSERPLVVRDMPEDLYHAHSAYSQSQFKLLPKQPELFYGYHVIEPPLWTFKQTDNMRLGTVLHGIHLEHKPLLVVPPDVLTSNGQRRGKKWEEWEQAHQGQFYLLAADAGVVEVMGAALMGDETVRRIIESDGPNELSLFWDDEETGLPLRARLDMLREGAGGMMIADLKSTTINVADPHEVASHIMKFGYHQQDALYCDGARICLGRQPEMFAFIFVRSEPPFNCCLWVMNPNDVALGGRRNRKALRDLKHRLDTGDWLNDRAGQVNYVELPRWAFTDDPADEPAFYAGEFIDLGLNQFP
jgi:hypothetical protein